MTHNPVRSRPLVIVPPRKPLTKAEKIAAWNREGGICWWCGKPVAALGLGVEYDHKLPRELVAHDDPANQYPMHAARCHERKTLDEDRPRITKAHHQERKSFGREVKHTSFRKHPTHVRGVDGQVRERRR